jgi:hypothetical protein
VNVERRVKLVRLGDVGKHPETVQKEKEKREKGEEKFVEVEEDKREDRKAGNEPVGQVKLNNKHRRRREKYDRVIEELKFKDKELVELKEKNQKLMQRVAGLESGGF